MRKPLQIAAIFIFCLTLIITFNTPAGANETQQNLIKVSGQGMVEAAPDSADLLLAVITEARDAREAQMENTSRSDRVIEALKGKGISQEFIQTQNYRLEPKYHYPDRTLVNAQENQPRIVGYTVHHQLKVKIQNINELGSLLDLAVEAGANQASNINFYIKDSLELKEKALRQAVAEARIKANVLASALGKNLIGVKTASGSWSENNPGPVQYIGMGLDDMARNEAMPTSIIPGTTQIRAHVDIEYLTD